MLGSHSFCFIQCIPDITCDYTCFFFQHLLLKLLCADSGLADALSTALFTLPQAEGQALLDRYGAEAMWVDASGGEVFSPGFSAYLRT